MALKHIKPDVYLLGELQDVSNDAGALSEYLRLPNAVPQTFPTHQLNAICRSLSSLPEGTAEGCRAPLEYARVRLPAIRREFILNEQNIPPITQDEIPPLVRGMTVDRLMRDLIASVSTALDEYRRQATESYDDSVGPEPLVDGSQEPKVSIGIADSRKLEKNLQEAALKVSQITTPESDNADRLLRRMKDVESVTRLARAELQMRTVVIRWYKNIAGKIRDYPKLLRDAGELIDVGVDVIRPLSKRWHRFFEESFDFLLEQVSKTGKTLVEIGNILDRRKTRKSQVADESELDSKVAKAEKAARELILAGIRPPPEISDIVERLSLSGSKELRTAIPDLSLLNDFHNLKHLDIIWSNIKTIEFLNFLPSQLRSLLLHGNKIKDLSPLESQRNLVSLGIRFGTASDLTPLAKLTKLNSLSVQANSASDLAPLAKLTNLNLLSVHANPASDLRPLATLTNLHSLSVQANASDLTPLAKLTNLNSLSVNANAASDLSPLAKLINLNSLSIHANAASDLRPLAKLTNLKSLAVQTNASDLSPLAKLTNLNTLSVNTNAALDLAPLAKLTNLDSLSVNTNAALDLAPLAKLTNLNSLSVQANAASDLAPLAKLTNLNSLNIQANTASDLAPLAKLTNLNSLSVHANAASDLTALGKLTNLNSLNIQANTASDLAPLGKLTNLNSLSVHANAASDVTPLAALSELKSLKLFGTKIRDLSPLSVLSGIEFLDISGTNVTSLKALATWQYLDELHIGELTIKDFSHVRHVRKISKSRTRRA